MSIRRVKLRSGLRVYQARVMVDGRRRSVLRPTREAAKVLGISTATADRYWAYARAWLQQQMSADRD